MDVHIPPFWDAGSNYLFFGGVDYTIISWLGSSLYDPIKLKTDVLFTSIPWISVPSQSSLVLWKPTLISHPARSSYRAVSSSTGSLISTRARQHARLVVEVFFFFSLLYREEERNKAPTNENQHPRDMSKDDAFHWAIIRLGVKVGPHMDAAGGKK